MSQGRDAPVAGQTEGGTGEERTVREEGMERSET